MVSQLARFSLVLFVITTWLSTSGHAIPQSPAKDWQPTADCSQEARTQLEINHCSSTQAEAAKATLSSLLTELSHSLEPNAWNTLRDIHLEWEALRDRDCGWEQNLVAGGSIAPSIYTNCVSARTVERIERLSLFLCEGAGMTGPCEASEKYAIAAPSQPNSSTR